MEKEERMSLKLSMMTAIIVVTLGAAACENTGTNTNANANANARTATPEATATASPGAKSRSEYTEKEAQTEREKAKQSGETIGDTLEDAWIHTKIVAQLIANSTTPERKINVDVVKNAVTLRGNVDTAEEKAAAEKIAKETEGVTKVVNQLKVAPAAKASPKTAGKTKPNY
jgi:hyperosmotically inducible periplasmic protein